jgi:hypothetical protein
MHVYMDQKADQPWFHFSLHFAAVVYIYIMYI